MLFELLSCNSCLVAQFDLHKGNFLSDTFFNPLNAELIPICHLLALLGAHHIFHVNRIRVNFPASVEHHHGDVVEQLSAPLPGSRLSSSWVTYFNSATFLYYCLYFPPFFILLFIFFWYEGLGVDVDAVWQQVVDHFGVEHGIRIKGRSCHNFDI